MPNHHVFLGLGSNVEREIHIEIALDMLEEHLSGIRRSPVYESISIDMLQGPFYNLVVSGKTDLCLYDLSEWLKEIEKLHGRRKSGQRLIPLDIDILLFDDLSGTHEGIELPRSEILERSFVLFPLQQLAPHLKHPRLGISFSELWHKLRPGPSLSAVRHPFGFGSCNQATQALALNNTTDMAHATHH